MTMTVLGQWRIEGEKELCGFSKVSTNIVRIMRIMLPLRMALGGPHVIYGEQ